MSRLNNSINETTSNHMSPVHHLETGKLGFNLPTNDTTKSGQLDNLSVDSYWVGEQELEEIEKEKKTDPISLDYKVVYHKMRDRAKVDTDAASPADEKPNNS